MRNRIAQLVDSAGSIPRDWFNKYPIKEVPLSFTFDDRHYFRENIDYSNIDFYLHMKEYPQQIPKTSAPNVYDWLNGYKEMYDKGFNRFIVTTIAGQLSASNHNALLARDIFLESAEDAEVEICDLQTCACGQAALEIKIAQIIQSRQLPWEDIINRIKTLIPKTVSLFTVQELTYMMAGGRIGGAAKWLGNLIKIMPVCEFKDGVVHPIKAVRGRKKALQYLVDTCANRIKDVNNTVIVTQHAICENDELFMIERLQQKLGAEIQIFRSRVGTPVGAHSGPGAIGIGFVTD
ncbi:MAG: DegV family protein [Syntrophomonadaceae bacterium]|nr:DegV family protein [Syntrophomonadaceae bacterium]